MEQMLENQSNAIILTSMISFALTDSGLISGTFDQVKAELAELIRDRCEHGGGVWLKDGTPDVKFWIMCSDEGMALRQRYGRAPMIVTTPPPQSL